MHNETLDTSEDTEKISMVTRVSIDDILEALGPVGRYQILQAIIVCISQFTISFHLFSFVFTAQPVDHQCKTTGSFYYGNTTMSDNSTTLDKCIVYNASSAGQTCTAWTYTSEKQHSIVSEWDLVCDEAIFARLPQSLFIVGQAIGAVIFSAVSDRFGRKPALVLAHFLTGCVGLGSAFSPNIAVFTILRLLNGICQQGIVVTGLTLMLEMFPMSLRITVASIGYFGWSITTVCLALTAYLLRNLSWRLQQMAYISVSLIVLLQLIFLKESLRWLITNKKTERVRFLIIRVAKMNSIDISTIPFKFDDSSAPLENEEGTKTKYVDKETVLRVTAEASQYKYFDLFRSKFLLKMSSVIWFSWLVDSLTYFSLYLTTSSLADDLYLNFFFNTLAEIPSGLLYWFVGRRFGRRRHFMIFHTVAGVCLILATGVKVLAVGQIASTCASVFAIIGKVGNTACFNAMFMYSPEIYPTNLRTTGIGAGSTAARVGGSIAPFISMLAAVVPWAPGTIFGTACLVAAAMNYWFPESRGQELPQIIDDIKSWERKTDST